MLPSLKTELQSPEVLAAALQPLLFMIEESTTEEYQNEILPVFRTVFSMPKSVQVNNFQTYILHKKERILRELCL